MKVAIFVLSDVGTHEGLGRLVNALKLLNSLKMQNYDVKLYFDGTGSKWIQELSKKDHIVYGLFESVKTNLKEFVYSVRQLLVPKMQLKSVKFSLLTRKIST